MKISFVSVFPQFISEYFSFGVFRVAQQKELAEFQSIDLRHFATDRHGTVDDRPFGGGDGMIMKPDSLAAAIESINPDQVVLLSPGGRVWNQEQAEVFSTSNQHVAFICGRFGGIDQRFIDQFVDLEVSVGDFVLSGGELPALMLVDSIVRLIPGVLGHPDSAQIDSFAPALDRMLEAPQYTRPREFRGVEVPEVLLSGHDLKIQNWRSEQSFIRTQKQRPDLLKKNQ